MEPPAISIEEQIAGVQDARDHLVRSVQWRAGRRSFSATMHDRQVERLDAAIATLKSLREAPR